MHSAFLENYVGCGGDISGDVEPGWFGWAKDDFRCQFTVGNGLGRHLSNSTDAAVATNFLGTTVCAPPRPGMNRRDGGIQHSGQTDRRIRRERRNIQPSRPPGRAG
jgi:hypothetical protein